MILPLRGLVSAPGGSLSARNFEPALQSRLRALVRYRCGRTTPGPDSPAFFFNGLRFFNRVRRADDKLRYDG